MLAKKGVPINQSRLDVVYPVLQVEVRVNAGIEQ